MKVSHSAITSSIYELVKTVEVDVQLGDDSWTYRIDLLRDTEKHDHFRCRAWENEFFHLTPTFPVSVENEPLEDITADEIFFVERGIPRSQTNYSLEDIIAPNVEAALEIVIDDIKNALEHWTREKAK